MKQAFLDYDVLTQYYILAAIRGPDAHLTPDLKLPFICLDVLKEITLRVRSLVFHICECPGLYSDEPITQKNVTEIGTVLQMLPNSIMLQLIHWLEHTALAIRKTSDDLVWGTYGEDLIVLLDSYWQKGY